MNLAAAKYRIAYEAFSKFSGSLNRVDNLEDLSTVVSRNLKYLFNFKIFRIILLDKDTVTGYTFIKNEIWAHKNQEDILDYEKKLLQDQIPFSYAISSEELPTSITFL